MAKSDGLIAVELGAISRINRFEGWSQSSLITIKVKHDPGETDSEQGPYMSIWGIGEYQDQTTNKSQKSSAHADHVDYAG